MDINSCCFATDLKDFEDLLTFSIKNLCKFV